MKNSKILLHVCCGICSLHVIEKLEKDFEEVLLFFYNPNIYPREEYERRLTVIKEIAKLKGLPLKEGRYEPDDWLKTAKGLENEPEGGRRCEVCYEMRLKKTAEIARELGCDYFATTLTISPHKKADVINKIGEQAAAVYGLNFLAEDFKKEDGFKKTMAEAKKHNFYRQNYCGCQFSK